MSTPPGRSTRRPVGLREVAERAGVSMKTVSNVVHGRPNVSDSTRERVREAIAALGYRPQLAARQLRTGQSGIVTLAVPSLSYSYFSDLAQALIDEAQRRGRTIMLHSTSAGLEEERKVLDGFDLLVGDGVIFSPLLMEVEELRARESAAQPMVLLGEKVPSDGLPAGSDHVRIDNVAAMREATAHLIAGGRRRIAFVGAPREDAAESGPGPSPLAPRAPRPDSGSLRLCGYRTALAAAGRSDQELLQQVADWHRADGRAAVPELLERAPDVDGIVCGNDELAIGVLAGLRDAGRRVPEEVAVVGYDDTPEAAYSSPPLTSIAPDKAALAVTVMELLTQRIEGEAGPSRVVDAPFRLIARDSSRPLGGSPGI